MVFQVWGLVSLLIFYLVIFLIGLYAARKLKKNNQGSESEDIMLAGRDLGLVVGMFSMTATWVDGGYINGAAEVVYKKGILWCQGPLGYSISLIIAGLFYATKMREKGYVTMLDPFYLKYGKWVTALLYIPSMLGDVLATGAILSALGDTVATVINLDYNLAIIISGAIATIYTLAGGMYSVTYTDVVELVCIFVGVWLCVPFCITNPAVSPLSENQDYWGTIQTSDIGVYVDGFFLLILGGIPWQCYFQRVLASRTPRIAKIVSVVAGIWCIIIAIPPVIIGRVALSTNWNQTAYNKTLSDPRDISNVLPLMLFNLTPKPVAYIGLGAVAAAVMSSSDANILSSSSQFVRIVYRNIFRTQASERELLWVMRAAMIVFGACATVISLTLKTIYGLWYLAGDLVYVLLFPQLTCLIFLESHCNKWGAVVAFFVCAFLRFIFGESSIYLPPLIKLPFYDEKEMQQRIPFKTIIALLGFILIIGVSKLNRILSKKSVSIADASVRGYSSMINEGSVQNYQRNNDSKNVPMSILNGKDNLGYD